MDQPPQDIIDSEAERVLADIAVPEPEPQPLSEIPGPPVGYVDLLNFGTEESIKKEAEKGRMYSPIRPSSSGKCTRELSYELMEYSKQASYEKPLITPETQRIFSLGHSVEWNIIKQLEQNAGEFFRVRYKQQGLSFFRIEATNRPEMSQWVEGSIDACFFSNEWKAVVDFKSKKDKFSSWYSTNWDETTAKLKGMKSVRMLGDSGTSFWVDDLEAFLEELDDPFFAANFLQLNLYANAQFLKERGIDHAAIIQINKNDCRLREVRFRPSEAVYLRIREKFEAAMAAADAGNPELAPRDYTLGTVKCAFCDFKKECWKDDPEEADPLKAYFRTLPRKYWATDVDRLPASAQLLLGELYPKFKSAADAGDDAERLSASILKIILDAGVRKIKFPDGAVYEAKHYKSPKPRIELKRTKV
jgi:hypothetical protein